MREDLETVDDVTDLGAATEVTKGIYDPFAKESVGTLQARDF